MEKDISWARYRENVNIAVGSYINYIMEKSVFPDIYENLLNGMIYPNVVFKPNITSLENIKNNVINSSKNFFNGVNLDIKWLNKEEIDKLRFRYGFDAHKFIMENANDGSIFDIPLMPSTFNSSFVDYHSGNSDDDFKEIVFKRIGIFLLDDEDIVEASYFHELGHALISRNWYMITNILFDEYIPHLLEMFYNYVILGDEVKYIKKLLSKMKNRTDGHLIFSKDCSYMGMINKEELIYALALVLSCITFEKYIDFNRKDKDEMENDIKDLLNGKITVEEFMKKYEINLDNDSSIKLYKRSVERVKSYNP